MHYCIHSFPQIVAILSYIRIFHKYPVSPRIISILAFNFWQYLSLNTLLSGVALDYKTV